MIYGHIWNSQFRNIDFLNLAKSEWEDTLKEIQDQALQQAIETCRQRHEMPPTLPQFYQLCRSYQPKKQSSYLNTQKEAARNREIAIKHLANLKQMLVEKKRDRK